MAAAVVQLAVLRDVRGYGDREAQANNFPGNFVGDPEGQEDKEVFVVDWNDRAGAVGSCFQVRNEPSASGLVLALECTESAAVLSDL